MFVDHYVIIKKFKEEMNNLLNGEKERYPVKERPNIFVNFNFFFCNQQTFQKNNV